jgi:hypothetical protein
VTHREAVDRGEHRDPLGTTLACVRQEHLHLEGLLMRDAITCNQRQSAHLLLEHGPSAQGLLMRDAITCNHMQSAHLLLEHGPSARQPSLLQPPPHLGRNVAVAKPELDRSHLHAMREAISMQSEALRGNQREGSSPLCTCMR